MKTLIKMYHRKPWLACLAAVLLAISILSGPADAMFVPAAPHQDSAGAAGGSDERETDLAKIQTVLESKIIRQKLLDYGLSPEETMARVNRLSDSQINLLATHTDALQAGGEGGSVSLVVVLLIVLLVVLLI